MSITIAPTSFAAAVGSQLRLVRQGAKRAYAAIGVAGTLVLLATIFAVRMPVLHGRSLEDGGMTLHFEWFSEAEFGMQSAPGLLAAFLGFLFILLVGMAAPFTVWSGEPPRARSYHWLLPIQRWKHDVARLVAGSSIVLVAVAGIAIASAIGLAVGGRADAFHVLTPLALVNLLTGPLTLYLLASAATIGFDKPGRALLIAWGALAGPYLLLGLMDAGWLYSVFHSVIGGPYGYGSALVGGLVQTVSQTSSNSTVNSWPLAASIWWVVSLVPVSWALFRQREA